MKTTVGDLKVAFRQSQRRPEDGFERPESGRPLVVSAQRVRPAEGRRPAVGKPHWRRM